MALQGARQLLAAVQHADKAVVLPITGIQQRQWLHAACQALMKAEEHQQAAAVAAHMHNFALAARAVQLALKSDGGRLLLFVLQVLLCWQLHHIVCAHSISYRDKFEAAE